MGLKNARRQRAKRASCSSTRPSRDPTDRVRAVLQLAEEQHHAILDVPSAKRRFRPIAQTYFVAADAAEEIGDTEWARVLRGYARRFLVVDWARRRWPLQNFFVDDIVTIGERDLQKEVRRFVVYPPSAPSHSFIVTMDRRNRVRPLKRQR